MSANLFRLPYALGCKLASVVVHAEELRSPIAHAFDGAALDSLLSDPDVTAWLAEMRALGLVPEKRKVTLGDTPLDRAVKSMRATKATPRSAT